MPTITPKTDTTAELGFTMLIESGSPVTHIHVNSQSDINSTWETQRFPVDRNKGEHQFVLVNTHCKGNEKHMWFRVQFENEAGLSEPSKSAQLDVSDMIPGVPENIRATSKAREIQLPWGPPKTNPGDVKLYHIQYQEKRSDEKFTSRTDIATNNEDRNLLITVPCTVYTLKVCARNANDRRSEYITLTVQTEAYILSNSYSLHSI